METVEQDRIDFSLIPWENPAPGMRYKLFRQGDTQLQLVEFTKEFVEPDWCRKGHVGYVIEGEIEVDFSGVKVLFKAGDGICIPDGDVHKHMGIVLTDTFKVIFVQEQKDKHW